MKRRNFLKLLGLSAVPISMFPGLSQAGYVTDIRHMRIKTSFVNKHRVIIDNSAEPALEDFDRYFGGMQWVKLNYRDINDNFYVPIHSQMFNVSEKSVITIVSPGGNVVTFSPQVDKVYGDFMKQVVVGIDYHGVKLIAVQQPHKIS